MEEGKILHIFILIFEAMKNPGTETLHSTKCNMNLLMYCITDIHIQFTTFLHVYKDYLFWDSANVIVIHSNFMWYLYVS